MDQTIDTSQFRIVHPELEIGVIDLKLLKKTIEDNTQKGEEGRLVKLEGIPWDEVDEIRLEFLNILKIDYLWILTGLVKLNISNNIIEKIENLDALVNLKELDLSYNKITKIENLESLKKLEVLTLYGNLISKIENLDEMENLLIFSIGKNNIEDINNILYMRQFEHLRSFNIANNPCCGTVANFREWIAAFLPNIRYYEYKMLMPDEKSQAAKKYKDELKVVIESEKERNAERERIKAEAAEEALNAGSFVEFLGDDTLFKKIFDGDADGRLLLTIPKKRIKEIFETYKKKFCAVTRELFEVGQEMYRNRETEIKQFLDCVDNEKILNQRQSQVIIEEFDKNKTDLIEELYRIFADINEDDESDDIENPDDELLAKVQKEADEILKRFNTMIFDTWSKLMQYELTLYSQIEEVNENFAVVITDMTNAFIEQSSIYFVQLRALESEYSDEMLDVAMNLVKELDSNHETEITLEESKPLSKELEKLATDKENIVQCIASSRDYHILQIDNREDRLTSRARNWLDNLVFNLTKDEIARDRAQILEINTFLNVQKKQFKEIFILLGGETEQTPEKEESGAESPTASVTPLDED